jgi:hypothetical protein
LDRKSLVSWSDQNRTGLCDQERNSGQTLAISVAVQFPDLILPGASAEDRALRGRNLSAA